MAELDRKLGKIIQLAKHGIGGEKEVALDMVRRICEEKDLDFGVVMSDDEKITKYTISYKSKKEMSIISGIAAKILDNPDGFYYNRWYKQLYVETTAAKYIELTYAIEIYLAAFRKERRQIVRDIPRAFAMKHKLWADSAVGGVATQKEWEAMQRRQALAETMADVNLRKGIGSGK